MPWSDESVGDQEARQLGQPNKDAAAAMVSASALIDSAVLADQQAVLIAIIAGFQSQRKIANRLKFSVGKVNRIIGDCASRQLISVIHTGQSASYAVNELGISTLVAYLKQRAVSVDMFSVNMYRFLDGLMRKSLNSGQIRDRDILAESSPYEAQWPTWMDAL